MLKNLLKHQVDFHYHLPNSIANAAFSRTVHPKTNKHLHITKKIKRQYLGFAYKASASLITEINQGYALADPLADAWVQDAKKLPKHGMDIFEQALNDGIDSVDAPASLQALFAQATHVPDWYDPNLVKLACRTLSRYPVQQGFILQSISLMGGYCVPALAAPLLATENLKNDVVARIGRTLCFLASVTIPQGLDRYEIGFKQTLKTRVIHAMVRDKLLSNTDSRKTDTSNVDTSNAKTAWQTDVFGLPINQSDMVATIMSFSVTVIHGLHDFKCTISETEKQAILHLWRYVAYIMGVDIARLPESLADCNQWIYNYLITQDYGDNKDKFATAHSLAESLHQLPMLIESNDFKGYAKLEQAIRVGVTRKFWGNDICDSLNLPYPNLAKQSVLGVAYSQKVLERLAENSETVEKQMQKMAENYRQSIKQKYLTACPQLAPLFVDIETLAYRVDWH